MAKDRIQQKDVIDPKIIPTFEELNKQLEASVKNMTDASKAATDLFKAFDPKNIQDITESQKEYNEVNEESQKQHKEAATNLEKLRKKIADVTEEEERLKIALQEKRKAIRESIKAQKDQSKETVVLTRELQKEVKTEKEATEQNKRLLKVRKELDTTTAKGAKQVDLINKKIDKNNDLIKENASGLEKQKIGIGDYKNQVSEALQEQDFFGTSLGQLKGIFTTTTGAIGAAVVAVTALFKAYTSSARGAEDLARATDRLSAITSSIGNAIADATGGTNLLDTALRSLQAYYFGAESVLQGDTIVAIKSTIRELGILEAEQEKQKKAQLNRAEVLRQIRDDERNSFEERKAANDALGQVINEREAETVALQEKILENYKTLLTFDEGNLEIQQAIKQVEFEIADAREEAQGFRSEQLANDLALSREFVANELELQQVILQGRIDAAEEGTAAWIRARQEMIDTTKELELQAAGENEQLQNIAIEKAKNSFAELSRFKIDIKMTEAEELIALNEEQDEAELERLAEKWDNETELILEKQEERNEALRASQDEEVNAQIEADQQKKDSFQSYVSFATSQASQLAASLINFASQELANQQMADIEKAKSRGASEEEIAKIEKKYAEKRKALALTQAVINTALAVTNALNTTPFMPLGIIMAVLAAAAGAIEIATISSASFAKGTKDSGSQWLDATVAEKGVERINLADGTSFYTPNKETKMLLPPHSEVVPNHQLQRELAEMQAINNNPSKREEEQRRKEEHKELISAIKNRDETYINITENGVSVTAMRGANRTDYLNRTYRT
jgi:hypothetical protein